MLKTKRRTICKTVSVDVDVEVEIDESDLEDMLNPAVRGEGVKIISDLARIIPPMDASGYCVFCSARCGCLESPDSHFTDCLWRRANEYQDPE